VATGQLAMKMEPDVYAAFRVLNEKLNLILRLMGEEIMPGLDDLRSEVARNTAADESARILILGLADKLQQAIDAGVDPVELQQLVDTLRGSTDGLVADVLANTPAQPPT
jgi:hypothetical protein